MAGQAGTQPPPGMVALSEKRCPTEDQPDAERRAGTAANKWCRCFGHADVSQLQRKLSELGDQAWTDAWAERENVPLKRPFHDKRGIGKLALIFCGTDLSQVYHLPQWYSGGATRKDGDTGEVGSGWAPLIEPIFASLGLRTTQVVRCLLAGMPGGAHITPHHDNGKWVSRTHRVHLPITTHSRLEFRAGPVFVSPPEELQRWAFDEGSVVELNNAAKHEVRNPAGAPFRVPYLHIPFHILSHLWLTLHRSGPTLDSMDREPQPLEDFEGAAGVTNLGNQTENPLTHVRPLPV